jgi:hypothetical protein
MKYICKSHLNIVQEASLVEVMGRKYDCMYCFLEHNKGENHHSWKGGISSLYHYLRYCLNGWRFDSMKCYNFKCIITGEKFDAIHHFYSFNKIVRESLTETNISIYDEINKYTPEELKTIEDKCIELHYKYGLGVPLTNKLHSLFHNIYGIKDNTPEQFKEFTKRYYNGEFQEVDKTSLFN